MSAPTSAVRRAIARAGDKGRAHLAAQQDTGTWIARCGRQVRGRDIRVDAGPTAGEHAEQLGNVFCADCRHDALTVADTVAEGVAVLLRVGSPEDAGVQLRELPLSAIAVDSARIHRSETDEALADLAHSIREHGLLQPIAVRRTTAGHELVAGHRRLAAAALAGLQRIPALVRDVTDEQAVVAALAENLHRADLDPIAQGRAYCHALTALQATPTALAARVGVSREQIANTIRLLALPAHLQEQVATGALSAAHGRALLRVTDAAARDDLAAQIAADGLTTRDADAAARRLAAPRPAAAAGPLVDVARALTALLDARVSVRALADRSRITIDVPEADLARVLELLGGQAAAA